MAHLEVQKKKGSSWWLWLLLLLIAAGLLYYFLVYKNNAAGNSAAVVANTDSSASAHTASTTAAGGSPNYDAVDFNSPRAAYEEMTDTSIGVSSNNNYTIYSVGENVLFAKDKADLQSNAASKLQQVSASINKRFSGASVGVYGHTDSTGTAGYNKQLGAERANAVKDWLVKNGNLPADKITVRSLGESQPVASNNTSAGRQENRYVKIVAFPQGSSNQ